MQAFRPFLSHYGHSRLHSDSKKDLEERAHIADAEAKQIAQLQEAKKQAALSTLRKSTPSSSTESTSVASSSSSPPPSPPASSSLSSPAKTWKKAAALINLKRNATFAMVKTKEFRPRDMRLMQLQAGDADESKGHDEPPTYVISARDQIVKSHALYRRNAMSSAIPFLLSLAVLSMFLLAEWARHPCTSGVAAFEPAIASCVASAVPLLPADSDSIFTATFMAGGEGGQISLNGVPFLFKGANWFGFETTRHCAYGLAVASQDNVLSDLVGRGINAIRLPLTAEAILATGTPEEKFARASAVDLALNPHMCPACRDGVCEPQPDSNMSRHPPLTYSSPDTSRVPSRARLQRRKRALP